MHRITRRELIKAGAAGLAVTILPQDAMAASIVSTSTEMSFHHDHILGTSLDLCFLNIDENLACEAERIVLAEIERLRKIFSLYDPTSELSHLNRSNEPFTTTPELLAVLREYELWQPRSGWSCNAQVGAFESLWALAERSGVLPDRSMISSLAKELRQPGWIIDHETGLVTKLTRHQLDLNAAAKGYIIGQAAAVVRAALPGLAAGLINLGGDMTGWGNIHWPIGIQSPATPADNAQPIGGLFLRNSAVATSGGYQRYYSVDDVRYSHLIDPRIGQPANHIASATVIAPDNMTANLLATTLCILNVEDGLRLTETVPGAQCLLITADGRTVTSVGWQMHTVHRIQDDKNAEGGKIKGDPWPDGFQVNVALEIPKIEVTRRYRRPYVAVWVESADGKPLRTLSVWGNSPKYLKDLNDWWKIGRDNRELIRAVTRATRGPGKYDLAWDGKDDKGKAVPQGTYTIRIEVHREFGKHLRQTGKIDCKSAPASITLDKNEETGKTTVDYRKKSQP